MKKLLLFFVRLEIESIQIETLMICPIVALGHAVWVEHRDDFKDEHPAK